MVDDQQTHSFPKDEAALDNVAQLHGLDSSAPMFGLLTPHIQAVSKLYDGLDGTPTESVPQQEASLEAMLREAGFPDAATAAQRVIHWRSGAVRALRTPAAREAFEAVLPKLIEGLGRAPDPIHAINQFSTHRRTAAERDQPVSPAGSAPCAAGDARRHIVSCPRHWPSNWAAAPTCWTG